MNDIKKRNLKQNAILFLIGFAGIVSLLHLIPQILIIQGKELPMPMYVIQTIVITQSTIMLIVMILLGSFSSKIVNLGSPLITALLNSEDLFTKLKPQIAPAITGGVIGGIFILVFAGLLSNYLPAEFLTVGEQLTIPWYAKILYGGITEEILIRWGMMSFIVWGSYRITQAKNTEVRSYNYVLGIVLSSLIFGLAHLPAAFAISPVITVSLIVYILVGNAAFSLIAGYLYWKRGLECAIAAHMIAHITMIIGSSITLF